MSVGLNADSRLEVFARGSDNALWHSWQTIPSAGPWSGFSSLGGTLGSGPSVARSIDLHLHVFARGTSHNSGQGELLHIHQMERNGSWSLWKSLGGFFTDTPVVGLNADGRMEVFVRWTDGTIRHIWETVPNGVWSNWSLLDGSPTIVGSPMTCSQADGRLEVFAQSTDDTLIHTGQIQPNKSDTGAWREWSRLEGPITGTPAVVLNADGRMEVQFNSYQNELRGFWQTAANQSDSWAGPGSLGGKLASSPVLSRNKDGRLEAFYVGPDEELHNNWQTAVNNGWSGENDREIGHLAPNLCVIRNGDLRLEVFTLDTTGSLWHTWQKAPAQGPWGIQNLGQASFGVKLVELGFKAGWWYRE